MSEYLQVSTVTGSHEEALKISETLVEKRLAGCVQILGPVTSLYWWKGRIEKAQEWLCLIKTLESSFEELKSAIQEVHSYEVPEILAVPVTRGNEKYLHWLQHEVTR